MASDVKITSAGIRKILRNYNEKIALAEYIWNGFDAKATTINIKYSYNEFGSRQKGDLFIDKSFKIHFRNHRSSKGEDFEEMEANTFAAAILMPRQILLKEISKREIDLADDEAIKNLASDFGVSSMAMTYRIANLQQS